MSGRLREEVAIKDETLTQVGSEILKLGQKHKISEKELLVCLKIFADWFQKELGMADLKIEEKINVPIDPKDMN